MDYGKTVNLPGTSFAMKGNLPQKEPQILEFWKSHPPPREKSPAGKFILHDGPPYANGHIHIGTALNKILKDIVVRYKTLSGYAAPLVPGWDCHGLPIEQHVLKESGAEALKSSAPAAFRRRAAEFALKYVGIQKEEFRRLGVFADWDKPYLTLAPYYEAAIVETFAALFEKKLIYRAKKPVYWCPTCRTALADAEVEYADHVSHSIYVKFAVANPSASAARALKGAAGKISAVIWTTTPWTLPANVALAFNPSEKYSVIKSGQDGEMLIVASRLRDVFLTKTGGSDEDLFREHAAEIPGAALEGTVFKNPLTGGDSVGVLADFVSMEDGTGIVHIAPGHGADDFSVGRRYGLPVVSPVDDGGVFTAEAAEFAGHKVFAANPLIVEKLKTAGALLYDDKITHSYPHCWRCKRAIIFRATEQWFLDVNSSGLKEKLLAAIEKVEWVPAYGKNRISSMTALRPDWCLSRQRLWGTPIPVFYCESCGEPLADAGIMRGIAGVFRRDGSDVWYEKPAEEILAAAGVSAAPCSECGSKKLRKETDIFDVWFDSGVSSFAVLNPKNFAALEAPADLYLEGSDQHRGWFQTSLIPSVALRGEAPYKKVLTHGFVVDGAGRKMSKSLGNVVAPEEIIKKYGADILRLWVAASDYSEDIRISPEIISGLAEVYRKIRNTLRYILGNISDLSPAEKMDFAARRAASLPHGQNAAHEYIFGRLLVTVSLCADAYEKYEFHKVVYHLNNFCVNDLSSFYFDILKDTLYCDGKNSPSRRAAQSSLEDIFLGIVKCIAPVMPFTAEDAWRSYAADRAPAGLSAAQSVFSAEFPDFLSFAAEKSSSADGSVLSEWEYILEARSVVNAEMEKLRATGEIGSSLECEVAVSPKNAESFRALEKHRALLPCIFIVSKADLKDASSDGRTAASVRKSRDKKCARCWKHSDDVGGEAGLPDVCPRCAAVVKELAGEKT